MYVKTGDSHCSSDEYINNGIAEYSGYMEGDTIKYICNVGYTLVGTDSRVCLPNGSWSGVRPECVRTGNLLNNNINVNNTEHLYKHWYKYTCCILTLYKEDLMHVIYVYIINSIEI